MRCRPAADREGLPSPPLSSPLLPEAAKRARSPPAAGRRSDPARPGRRSRAPRRGDAAAVQAVDDAADVDGCANGMATSPWTVTVDRGRDWSASIAPRGSDAIPESFGNSPWSEDFSGQAAGGISRLSISRVLPSRPRPAPPAARLPVGACRSAAGAAPCSRAASRAALSDPSRAPRSRRSRARPILHRRGHGLQRARSCTASTRCGRQVAVARRQGQPVVGAPGFAADDLDRQRELPHHVADDQQLLVVLLAEHRHARLHAGEQLHHHRAHADEEARAEVAFEDVGQGGRRDAPCRSAARDTARARRREQHVAAGRLQLLAVALPGARIGVEVFVRHELQAVHEDAGDRRRRPAAWPAAPAPGGRRAGCPWSARRRGARSGPGGRAVRRWCGRSCMVDAPHQAWSRVVGKAAVLHGAT